MRYVNISLENKPDIRNVFRNERNYILNEINNRLDDVRKIILGFINFLELYLYIFNYILEYTQFTQGILIQSNDITN